MTAQPGLINSYLGIIPANSTRKLLIGLGAQHHRCDAEVYGEPKRSK
jgi:hypothetical protein